MYRALGYSYLLIPAKAGNARLPVEARSANYFAKDMQARRHTLPGWSISTETSSFLLLPILEKYKKRKSI